jgi:hypothetical protein
MWLNGHGSRWPSPAATSWCGRRTRRGRQPEAAGEKSVCSNPQTLWPICLATTVGVLWLSAPSLATARAWHSRECGEVSQTSSPQHALTVFRCAARDALRDPASGQFRHLFITKVQFIDGRQPPWEWALCGDVNRRNAFGGMTGWHRFVFMPGAQATDPLGRVFFNGNTYCGPAQPVLAGAR